MLNSLFVLSFISVCPKCQIRDNGVKLGLVSVEGNIVELLNHLSPLFDVYMSITCKYSALFSFCKLILCRYCPCTGPPISDCT